MINSPLKYSLNSSFIKSFLRLKIPVELFLLLLYLHSSSFKQLQGFLTLNLNMLLFSLISSTEYACVNVSVDNILPSLSL